MPYEGFETMWKQFAANEEHRSVLYLTVFGKNRSLAKFQWSKVYFLKWTFLSFLLYFICPLTLLSFELLLHRISRGNMKLSSLLLLSVSFSSLSHRPHSQLDSIGINFLQSWLCIHPAKYAWKYLVIRTSPFQHTDPCSSLQAFFVAMLMLLALNSVKNVFELSTQCVKRCQGQGQLSDQPFLWPCRNEEAHSKLVIWQL